MSKSYKKNELNSKRKIICLGGKIGSGKDTTAGILVREYGFKQLSFASKLKDITALAFGWDRDMLEGNTNESRTWREEVDSTWNITPRDALRKVGYEMFRQNICDDFWIRIMQQQIDKIDKDQDIVISDVRFENEMEFVKSINGVLVYIENNTIQNTILQGTIHPSDAGITKLIELSDHTLDNIGTISDLKKTIDTLLYKIDN